MLRGTTKLAKVKPNKTSMPEQAIRDEYLQFQAETGHRHVREGPGSHYQSPFSWLLGVYLPLVTWRIRVAIIHLCSLAVCLNDG